VDSSKIVKRKPAVVADWRAPDTSAELLGMKKNRKIRMPLYFALA